MFPILALAVLSFVGASTLQVNNYCSHAIWLSLTNPNQQFAEPIKVKSGEAYSAGENMGEGSA